MSGPFVLITSIPRSVQTTLGVAMDNATINQRFGELVVAAGGVPVASDAWAEPETLLERVDALILNGGGDVAPELYGAERLAVTDAADRRRDEFELRLARAALERELPVLGVCRGIQLLNVALGGTLVQDLGGDTAIEHYAREAWDRPVHDVEIEPGSRLARAYGRRTSVNSVHHQAVDRIGEGLRVSARAADGVIEGIEDERGLAIGVQWHPEFLAGPAGDAQVKLFREVLSARSGSLV
jgi:putative glutamine amidotransferase